MRARWSVALVLLLLLGACDDDDARTIRTHDDGGRPEPDAGPPPSPTEQLDLLFLVDNSIRSMVQEQASLAAALPALMTALATGDHDGDGRADARPFRSIRVGVITSDMGSGGATVPTCERPDFGDDGILRTQGRADLPGCNATYPSVLALEGGIDPLVFGSDVGCVARTGTDGCGFEQQLEAVLKAITPTSAQRWTAPTFVPVGTPSAPHGLDRAFFRASSPHGNLANAGFVRDDSMLAIVILTDDDDCSAHDHGLYNPSDETYGVIDLNLRCLANDALHPISRYVAGLLQLRRHPSRLAFLAIAGLPDDLEPAPGAAIDWDRLVGPSGVRDRRMEPGVDGNVLRASCDTSRGIAGAPVRILRVARGLDAHGARVAVGSICQESYPFASFLAALRR